MKCIDKLLDCADLMNYDEEIGYHYRNKATRGKDLWMEASQNLEFYFKPIEDEEQFYRKRVRKQDSDSDNSYDKLDSEAKLKTKKMKIF
jgi:hypothetical protein